MQSRPGFSTITIALTVLSTTARAAEPIAPAAHPAPSVHSTAKGGTVPHSGPTATTPGGMFPVERRAVRDARQGGDMAVQSGARVNGLAAPPGALKPADTISLGAVGRGAATGPTRARNTGQINGTRVVRTGAGPASIGVISTPRTGINGTGFGTK